MAEAGVANVVVTDANVIINMIHIGRLDLLTALPGYRFVVPDHVVAEITDRTQVAQVQAALNLGYFEQTSITDFHELATYADLNRVLGQGEAACLAIAEHRGCLLASDEKRAFRRLACERIGDKRLLTTVDIILSAIKSKVTTVGEADQWKDVLEKNRFKCKFNSFADLM